MCLVKQRAAFLAVMVLGITIMLWAGWHNLRDRRLRMQQAEANHVELTPAGKGAAGASAGGAAGDEPVLTGKAAPTFALVDLNGKRVSLADYRGRPVLVNFWATWCAPCKLEMPWFEEFRKQYQAQGFEILGINEDPESGKEAIARTAKTTGVSYPILLTDDKVAQQYGGVGYLPESFYVDRTGKIVEQTAGLGTRDEIEANIKKLVGAPGAVAAVGPAPLVTGAGR